MTDTRTVEDALRQAIFTLVDRLEFEKVPETVALTESVIALSEELRMGRAESAYAWDDEPEEVQS